MSEHPIAFFFTIATYGCWLPGDQRGWVEYRRGWRLPAPIRENYAFGRMSETACVLNARERGIVERQLAETCQHRGWILFARSCRTNHLHAVIGAHDTAPRKVRHTIKAWCTRRLKEQSNPARTNWWAERGSIRWIFDEPQLEIVIRYVSEAQDRKSRDLPQSQPDARKW